MIALLYMWGVLWVLIALFQENPAFNVGGSPVLSVLIATVAIASATIADRADKLRKHMARPIALEETDEV